ncbi:MAG: ABC transporter permease [Oscillospiraceae bacterium]|nr:ABC transporter permease [Oscillospiraceae bacterium]
MKKHKADTLKRKKSPKQIITEIGVGALGILSFLLVWHLAVVLTPLGELMPSPITVITYYVRSFVVPIGPHTMDYHLWVSFQRVMIGYIAAAVLGIICGVGMGVSKLFEAIFKPLFELMRPIPTLAWIPLAILWFGASEMAIYFIIFYGAFTTTTINAYAGVKQADPVLVGAARMLGAKKNQILWKVILPAALPNIAAGLQVALSIGWMGVVAAEMVRSRAGLGWIVIMGQETANMTQILGGMISIGLIGLTLATLMRLAERKLCAWNTRST